jgi:Icc-related predicted phosphoesterase
MHKILHSSDLHSNLDLLLMAMQDDWELLVDTGDALPNYRQCQRPMGLQRDYDKELRLQQTWFDNSYAERLIEGLRGRPVIGIAGNHDTEAFTDFLKWRGYKHVKTLRCGEPHVINGIKFAGHRGVPYLSQWYGYFHNSDLEHMSQQCLQLDPDVFVTHGPPQGVLSHLQIWGTPGLEEQVRLSTAKYHLFGHIHEQGGRSLTRDGVTYINGACHVIEHELEL